MAAPFSAVRDAFASVLDAQPGTGASFAIWYDGDWVVDLWGGYADAAHTRPWERDTLVMPYSVTKPIAALPRADARGSGSGRARRPAVEVLARASSAATVRDALSHRAGLVVLDDDAPEEAFYDWDLLCSLLAAQEPTWPPGRRTASRLCSTATRSARSSGRSTGAVSAAFLREEIFGPLGIDFHIGLGDAELARVADLTGFGDDFQRLAGGLPGAVLPGHRQPARRTDPQVVNGERWRRAEIPAVNGHGTARAVAEFYVALSQGRLLSPALMAELTRGRGPEPDLIVGGDREWGLGVGLDPDGYGMGGTGGSFGWWSEPGQYAVAFLTGHVGTHDRGDRLEGVVRDVLGLPPL